MSFEVAIRNTRAPQSLHLFLEDFAQLAGVGCREFKRRRQLLQVGGQFDAMAEDDQRPSSGALSRIRQQPRGWRSSSTKMPSPARCARWSRSAGGSCVFAIASTDGLGYRIFLMRRYLAMDYGLRRLVDRCYGCSVVGASGCGKSTLFRIILGQEGANSGEVLIDGKPVGPPAPDRGIVYQKYSLYLHLAVLDKVMLWRNHEPWIFRAPASPRRVPRRGDELSRTREDMQVFLLELWDQQRMTVFFVTHDNEERGTN